MSQTWADEAPTSCRVFIYVLTSPSFLCSFNKCLLNAYHISGPSHGSYPCLFPHPPHPPITYPSSGPMLQPEGEEPLQGLLWVSSLEPLHLAPSCPAAPLG